MAGDQDCYEIEIPVVLRVAVEAQDAAQAEFRASASVSEMAVISPPSVVDASLVRLIAPRVCKVLKGGEA